MTRWEGQVHDLLTAVGVDPVDWRDEIVTVLAWREGATAAREGRPAGSMADSLAERRYGGAIAVDADVHHIFDLASDEAVANGQEAGAAHLLVALLREGESVAAATGRWLGMTPGRVRSAAGLRNERRVVAEGAPPGGGVPATGDALVLCGGGTDADLLAEVIALAPRRRSRTTPEAVVVDLGWQTRLPAAEQRQGYLELFRSAGAEAAHSGIDDRSDASSAKACDLLAAADIVWFAGGDAAAIYHRLSATPALEAIREAHQGGAIVGGVSAGAMVWGTGTLSDFASLGDPEPFPLFGWLANLVVFPHYGPRREQALRERVRVFPGCRGLAIAHGGAVIVRRGGAEIEVLRHGARGTAHALLEGPDEVLTVLG